MSRLAYASLIGPPSFVLRHGRFIACMRGVRDHIDAHTRRTMAQHIPRISIGMPVYNGERYLAKALDSILAQTYTDFECVISDNASTDGTQELCLIYAARDQRIRYFRNERNLGAAPNYNRAFELSSGVYFKWADYDDEIAPSLLERCVAVLDQSPEVVLSFPRARIIDENGNVLGDHVYKADAGSPDVRTRFRNLVRNPDMGFEISGLLRADTIRQTGLHRSFPSSDLVFLAELALHGRFHEIPESLFFPRYHPEQSTKGAGAVERDRVTFFDTANAGRILLPKWQYLFGYMEAISNSPLGRRDRSYCYRQLIPWILRPDHIRALGKDMLIAGQKLLSRSKPTLAEVQQAT